MCAYLKEQQNLCIELAEQQKSLPSDPLPSEADMLAFADHLQKFWVMKSERL
jgi:hypothetical protein